MTRELEDVRRDQDEKEEEQKETIDKLNHRQDELEIDLRHAENARDVNEREILNLKRINENLETKIETYDHSCKLLQKKILDLESLVELLKKETGRDEYGVDILGYKTEIESLKKSIELMTGKLEEAKRTLMEGEQEKNAIKAKLNAKERALMRYDHRLEIIQKRLEDKNKNIGIIQRDKRELNIELNKLNRQIAVLQKKAEENSDKVFIYLLLNLKISYLIKNNN